MYVEITTLKTYVCWYEERKLYSDIVWLQISKVLVVRFLCGLILNRNL